MKRFITYKKLFAALLLFVLAASGCGDEPDRILYKGPAFVFFESKDYIPVLESSSATYKVALKVSAPQKNDFTVAYEVQSEGAVSDVDYRIISPNPITMEAGEYVTYIEIEMINNEVIDSETRQFNLIITDISNSSLQKQILTSVNVEVVNDDCLPGIPKITTWVGTVAIEDVGGADGSATGLPGSGGSCGGILVLNGDDVFGFGVGNFEIKLVFTPDAEGSTTGTVLVSKGPYFEDSDYSAYHYAATGTYDEATKEILLDYIFYDDTGAPWFGGQHVISVP